MAFNYFLIAVCGIYLLYYMALVGMDLLRMKKDTNGEEHGKDIDISDAVAGYKPQVAAEVMKKESEEILREMNAGDSSENTPKVPYEEEESITDFPNPYEMPGVYFSPSEPTGNTDVKPAQTDDSNDDTASSGALNIQYDPAEEKKDKFPEININGGYSAFHIKDMMDDMAINGQNLFAHINLVG